MVVHVEKGGFGDVAAAPVARQILSQWFFGKPGQYVAGTNSLAMSATPLTPAEETIVPPHADAAADRPAAAAGGDRADALLAGDAQGRHLARGSGQPLFYVQRQALYGGVGLLLALVLSRIDYSRLREFKYGLYGMMIALNLVVYGMPPIQGARRWIPLPFLQFQSSEFGKVLLIVALAGFAVDRSRRIHEWRTTARIMLLAILAALLVIPQPDLGTGMVYVAVGFSILFFAGTSWKQLARARGDLRRLDRDRARRGARGRGARAQALPGAAADGVPEPERMWQAEP